MGCTSDAIVKQPKLLTLLNSDGVTDDDYGGGSE